MNNIERRLAGALGAIMEKRWPANPHQDHYNPALGWILLGGDEKREDLQRLQPNLTRAFPAFKLYVIMYIYTFMFFDYHCPSIGYSPRDRLTSVLIIRI